MSSNVLRMQPQYRTDTHRSLQGKVAVVTGASSGIGKAIAIEMGRRGASIVVNYIGKGDAAEEVVKAIQAEDADAVAVQADVSKSADVSNMVARAVSSIRPH